MERAKRRLPTPAKWGLAVIVILAILVGVYFWTTSMGKADVLKSAQENNLCTDTACSAGIAAIYEVAKTQYDMGPALLEWCLGTDDWADTKVTRGGLIRDIFVSIMRFPCGKLMPAPELPGALNGLPVN